MPEFDFIFKNANEFTESQKICLTAIINKLVSRMKNLYHHHDERITGLEKQIEELKEKIKILEEKK